MLTAEFSLNGKKYLIIQDNKEFDDMVNWHSLKNYFSNQM